MIFSKKRQKHRTIYIALLVICSEAITGLTFFTLSAFRIQQSAFLPGKQVVYFRGLDSMQYKQVTGKLFSIIQKQDPRVALEKLKQEMHDNPKVLASCHELLHDIGRKSYEKYHDFAKAMYYGDEVCVSGYMHGVIEGYFLENKGSFSQLLHYCALYSEGKYLRWQCYHGMGHGLMYYTANNLLFSLKQCSTLSTEFDQRSCYNGVYMENFTADTLLHPSKFVSFSDPFQPCRLSSLYQEECYVNASIFFLNYHPGDYKKALLWCTTAPIMYRNVCYKGVANEAVKRDVKDVKRIEAICMSQERAKVRSCLAGIVSWYMQYYSSPEHGRELCQKLQVVNQKICSEEVDSYKNLF